MEAEVRSRKKADAFHVSWAHHECGGSCTIPKRKEGTCSLKQSWAGRAKLSKLVAVCPPAFCHAHLWHLQAPGRSRALSSEVEFGSPAVCFLLPSHLDPCCFFSTGWVAWSILEIFAKWENKIKQNGVFYVAVAIKWAVLWKSSRQYQKSMSCSGTRQPCSIQKSAVFDTSVDIFRAGVCGSKQGSEGAWKKACCKFTVTALCC